MDGGCFGLSETEVRTLLERVCEEVSEEDVDTFSLKLKSEGGIPNALLALLDEDDVLYKWFRELRFCNIADSHRERFVSMICKGRSIDEVIDYFRVNSHVVWVAAGEYRRSLK